MNEKGGQKHRSKAAGLGVFAGRFGAGLLLALGLIMVFALEYKADLRQNLEKSIPVTMYFKHKENTVQELADLFYHALVMMAQLGITPEEVEEELKKR